MTEKNPKRKRRPSLFWGLANRLTAIIYSFFVHGRVGDMLSSDDTLCKRSYLASRFGKKRKTGQSKVLNYTGLFIEQSVSSRSFVFIRGFWASLKLNVYGAFFCFYGLSACIAYLFPAFISGFSSYDAMSIIASAAILICSIPLLFSSQSAIEAISSSRLMGNLVLETLCIPEERLKVKKQYGGTVYIFIASVAAMPLGVLSFYTDPLFIPIVLLCLMLLLAIFSYPEIGVIITLAVIPFMKYLPNPELVLIIMVVSTAVSYFCKVFQRKRIFSLSPEISMVILFCGFIVTGGMFSYGGLRTFTDSAATVILILGGFLVTYNLINTFKLVYACVRTLTVSFLVLCLVGIWESVYNGISARIIDSVNPNISNITDESILYILDNGIVFGMFAIFVFPMLFAYMAKRKSVQGAAAMTVLCVILISAAWMCSHYEIIVALVIECVLFWFMFSHKTMTMVIFALIPVGITAMLYPYAVEYLGWPNISEILMEYMPGGITDSELFTEASVDIIRMLTDGNMFGIGAGEHAFKNIFPAYSSAASHGSNGPVSLWLQVLCWSGIFGAVAFSVFAIFITRRSFGFLISSERNEHRTKALALFCGLAGAVLLGGVYGIWTDGRVMYLFWVYAGLLMSQIKLGNEEQHKHRISHADTVYAADTEVVFYD